MRTLVYSCGVVVLLCHSSLAQEQWRSANSQVQGRVQQAQCVRAQPCTVERCCEPTFSAPPPDENFAAPPPTGEFEGESNSVGVRGLGIRFPEFNLELPTIQLPNFIKFRRDAVFRSDRMLAPMVPEEDVFQSGIKVNNDPPFKTPPPSCGSATSRNERRYALPPAPGAESVQMLNRVKEQEARMAQLESKIDVLINSLQNIHAQNEREQQQWDQLSRPSGSVKPLRQPEMLSPSVAGDVEDEEQQTQEVQQSSYTVTDPRARIVMRDPSPRRTKPAMRRPVAQQTALASDVPVEWFDDAPQRAQNVSPSKNHARVEGTLTQDSASRKTKWWQVWKKRSASRK